MKNIILCLLVSVILTSYPLKFQAETRGCQKCEVSPPDVSDEETVHLTRKELKKRIVRVVSMTLPPNINAKIRDKTVIVDVFINKEGRVVLAVASKGHPGLKSSGETAARFTQFKPLNIAGKPVNVCGQIILKLNSKK